ncbi:DUF397 domain-containing protein [Streptomyces sp. NBC_01615]|uniref:DUF397 domain-containing protein n=1 Tax=Streptomyces sp. NBC_01615 TaxID=2975898 RepID=UPI00386F4024
MIQWQKSSFSGGGDGDECVEVGLAEGVIHVRESDEPDRILPVTRDSLTALIHRLRANRT